MVVSNKKVKRNFFTLLEMLIVMMILSFVLSVIGVKGYQIYKEQQFLTDVQQVLNKLRTAQELMALLNTDVFVELSYDSTKQAVSCRLDVQKPLQERWSVLIEKPLFLKAINSWEFKKETSDPLLLQFILGGMSQGTLILKSGAKDYSIALLGYPGPIEMQTKNQTKDTPSISAEVLYPADVYKDFYE